jgi:hypothetical protein
MKYGHSRGSKSASACEEKATSKENMRALERLCDRLKRYQRAARAEAAFSSCYQGVY